MKRTTPVILAVSYILITSSLGAIAQWGGDIVNLQGPLMGVLQPTNGGTGMTNLPALAAALTPTPQVTSGSFTAAVGQSYVNNGGSLTLTLPTAVGNGGESITYMSNGAATTSIATTGGQTVGGALTGVLTLISSLLGPVYVTFTSDGANWHITATGK